MCTKSGKCFLDREVLDLSFVSKAQLLDSIDVTDIHGGLLALTELAAAYSSLNADDKLRGEGRHEV